MNTRTLQAVTWIGLAGLTGSAVAGGYAGITIGQATIDEAVTTSPGTSIAVNEDSLAWKVYGGFGLTEYFGAELGWADLGDHNESGLANLETEGFYMAGTATLPLGEDSGFYATAKLGAYVWDQDINSASHDGTDAMYGVGLKYIYDEIFGVALEWERYNAEADADLIGLGLTVNF